MSIHKSKIDMCDIIRDKVHNRIDKSAGKFFHYSVILPSVADAGWWEKVGFRIQ